VEAYLGLFAAAFAAATLLPFYSEATAGNTLGAAVNWAIGRWLMHFQDRRWFPFKERQIAVAQRWYQRWGVWSLLLAWLPVGGDALTFIAGIMRVRFDLFFLLTAIGKGARYAVLLGLLGWLAGT
jgi:membrane protein YqaA with SNARE-associated domain